MRTSPLPRSPASVGRRCGSSALAAPAVLLLTLVVPLSAQLPPPDAFAVARAGEAAFGRPADPADLGGIPSNPAALSGRSGWSISVLPFTLGLGLGPVTGRDLVRAGDGVVSAATRQAWLQQVEREGGQRGRLDAVLTPLAARVGPLSVQLSTLATGSTRLPADAVELILFGNAGRTGEAEDFVLRGTAFQGVVMSTLGVAWGFSPRPQLALGVRLHGSVGHAVLVGRDAGSVLGGDGADADIRLPTIAGDGRGTRGSGMGLDAGVRWLSAGSATEVAVHNVATGFAWSPDQLVYRPGETLIRGEGIETDFDPRPVTEAPALLHAALDDLVPATRIEAEHVRTLGGAVKVRAAVRETLGSGLALGRPAFQAIGAEWSPGRFGMVAGHVGASEGHLRLGAGARIAVGRWTVAGAWSLARAGARDGSEYALSVRYESRPPSTEMPR